MTMATMNVDKAQNAVAKWHQAFMSIKFSMITMLLVVSAFLFTISAGVYSFHQREVAITAELVKMTAAYDACYEKEHRTLWEKIKDMVSPD